MIDIENQLYGILKPILVAKYPTIELSGENYISTPTAFPAVSILEADNYSVTSTRTTDSNENHDNIIYDINIYTNDTDSKKQKAKEILSTLDDELNKLGFTRVMKQPIPMSDGSIFRLIARYEAVVSKNHTIYRR